MRIAYVVSGLTTSMTFVVNEMQAHEDAGWKILPLISCRKYKFENLSPLMLKWNQKSLFRASQLLMFLCFLKTLIASPIKTAKVFCWLCGLLLVSVTEFMKAAYEFLPAFYYSQICNAKNIEHLHVHFASRSLSLGIMISILTEKPVSCTVHAFDIFTRLATSLRYRLRKCKFVATISQYNMDYLRENCGDDVAGLCHIVHCGIDINKFSSEKRKSTGVKMVAVARLTPKKGFDYAIKACAELKKANINFRYDIIGGGEEYEQLCSLIEANDLEGNVFLHGPKNNDEVRDFLKEASLFLMTCITLPDGDMDGIPVAMMEAMSCGIPVVSTDISGIPELIKHGYNGWMVPEKDVNALVGMLRYLLQNYGELTIAGENATKYIQEEFNIKKNAQKLRGLISE